MKRPHCPTPHDCSKNEHYDYYKDHFGCSTCITKFDNDFDLVSGRYVIDAKSIMGIFSLDLSKPIELNIHSEGNVDEILSVLQPYIVD